LSPDRRYGILECMGTTGTAAKEQNDRVKVAVIGLGRFGKFWAELLADTYDVVGTSRRTIHDLKNGVTQVDLDEALQRDIVFLTVSISAIPSVLDEIAPRIRTDSTVVDTCSVKLFPVAEMETRLPSTVDIIASHPMFGPDSAGERTDKLPMITWPIRDTHRRYAEMTETLGNLRMKIVEMTPDEHDREAAFSQGVTHLVGRVLDEMDLTESPIATLGYTRLMQVREQTCNDPIQLFKDLQRFNPYTKAMRQRFSKALAVTEHLLLDQEI
jgi:prephenate dehydrogenase